MAGAPGSLRQQATGTAGALLSSGDSARRRPSVVLLAWHKFVVVTACRNTALWSASTSATCRGSATNLGVLLADGGDCPSDIVILRQQPGACVQALRLEDTPRKGDVASHISGAFT